MTSGKTKHQIENYSTKIEKQIKSNRRSTIQKTKVHEPSF